MKKTAVLLLIAALASISVYAATYTVKPGSGTIKSPSGKIQQTSKKQSTNQQTQNIMNTYSVTNYTSRNEKSGIIDIVVDYSGSMGNWVSAVENAVSSIVSQLPSNISLGMRVAGFNTISSPKRSTLIKGSAGKYSYKTQSNIIAKSNGSCTSSHAVIPIGDVVSASAIQGTITTGGSTPLVYGMEQAISKDFAPFGYDIPKKIILITDGGENCGGDPCAFASTVAALRKDITIDVVLVSPASAMHCLATQTGGHIYSLSNISDTLNTLTNSVYTTPVNNTVTMPKQTNSTPEVLNSEYIPE